ncbi:hypothetical protein Dform_00058 [Dehalogenimonas formicexedens]|uniref:Spermatogenesis-associated protein 20-like TRX domain-containing protein n=1 Tax=Dehalogenimonas formicexedens TaxID=1839801 RepID=A0A1P8F4N9_9CHLR|nr:thioredoxin domain-containing protein [Dehalogenimonas formicexedens]APV43423.1 hypothetical protein Dform_00058 [Dehalogenimonas formicexedens]
MSNRLAQETSPYLLQHADNPVDWYPWGKDAFDAARAEDKPILLSIGYSACHWCHVMAHESFENRDIAREMNEKFINIKVDREERPDLDEIYMQAVSALTGHGGWPLTVFLTPDGKPFYGSTYFPPEDKHGLPGFPRVLRAIADSYRRQRPQIERAGSQIAAALSAGRASVQPGNSLAPELLDQAYEAIKGTFDRVNGGFGSAPKFPQASVLEFLMRYYHRTKNAEALRMVTLTLDKMAAGGIYDQLGGGFHRYATDAIWVVPHFEKMLYDNALLAGVYLHAFMITQNGVYRKITEETLDYALREMRAPEGGFFSSQDADSEGEEGKYFLWDLKDLSEVFPADKAGIIAGRFGVTPEGQIDGRSVLHLRRESLDDPSLEADKKLMLAKREQRIKPGTDIKVLSGWNGLMIASLAEASCVLDRPDYLQAAIAGADFILDHTVAGHRLRHVYAGGRSKTDAFLQDYAFLAEAFIKLNEVTADIKWLDEAEKLAEFIVDNFWDEEKSALFDTVKGQQETFMRPQSILDSPIPSGGSATTMVLLKIGRITGNPPMTDLAEKLLGLVSREMPQNPQATSHWLNALTLWLSDPFDVVIAGGTDDPATRALLRQGCAGWLPDKLQAGFDPASDNPLAQKGIFKGKSLVNERSAAYVCSGHTCHPPVSDPGLLADLLK